jgi:hypothetical protein
VIKFVSDLDAILLIIDIVYGVCRIVIKSVQQCTYFLFFVNLRLVGVNIYDLADNAPLKQRYILMLTIKNNSKPFKNPIHNAETMIF